MQIDITLIDPPLVPMREVDKGSAEFRELVDSIRDHGQHNSILVRPKGDRYEAVDGAHRLAAHIKLRLPTIEATVREMTDNDVLICQIQANAVRKETSRIDYAKHLLRIQHAFPDLSMTQLAKFAGKERYWVRQQLDLLDLRPEYQTMADRGHLPVLNAYALAKLPPHIQGRYIDQATTLSPAEFKVIVAEHVRTLMVNAKTRAHEERAAAATAEPHAFLRPFKHLTEEVRTGSAARGIIADVKPSTHVDAFTLGVKWALNLDPQTLAERKEKLAKSSVSRKISRK